MPNITVTNIVSTPVLLQDLYATLEAGQSLTVYRSQADLTRMVNLHQAMVDSKVTVTAVATADEVAALPTYVGLPVYNNGSEPATPLKGFLVYSDTDDTVRCYNGVTWVSVISGATPPFGSIAGGTNNNTLIVGAGGSLSRTGGGTIDASSLLGATWAAPAAIGSGTAAAGTFTGVNAPALDTATAVTLAVGGVTATEVQVGRAAGKVGLYGTTPVVKAGAIATPATAALSVAMFTGSGIDDATSGGTYTGSAVKYYRVEIDATGTPDTFKWSDDGGATWDATGVAITGAAQTLNAGVTITFAATTGHTLTDRWDFVTLIDSGARSAIGSIISALQNIGITA